jgi:hypothetical protein
MYYSKLELYGKSRREKRKIAKWHINKLNSNIKTFKSWKLSVTVQMWIDEALEWRCEWENALKKI